jgi:zinc transporter ZupT
VSTQEWLVAGVLALALAGAHFFAYRVSKLPAKVQDVLASVGGGAAIAYIFVHLMPELAIGGRNLTELNIAQFTPTPITEAGLFLTAMVGLVTFFVLDIRTEEGRASTRTSYRIHMLSFASISAIYAYTLPSLVTTGLDYAILFTVVIGAHLLLADRALARAHPNQFAHETRWVGIAAVAIGFLASYLLPPANEYILAVATAFLGGVLLLTTFREELPSASRARVPWFLLGVSVMTVLLLIALAISDHA